VYPSLADSWPSSARVTGFSSVLLTTPKDAENLDEALPKGASNRLSRGSISSRVSK